MYVYSKVAGRFELYYCVDCRRHVFETIALHIIKKAVFVYLFLGIQLFMN